MFASVDECCYMLQATFTSGEFGGLGFYGLMWVERWCMSIWIVCAHCEGPQAVVTKTPKRVRVPCRRVSSLDSLCFPKGAVVQVTSPLVGRACLRALRVRCLARETSVGNLQGFAGLLASRLPWCLACEPPVLFPPVLPGLACEPRAYCLACETLSEYCYLVRLVNYEPHSVGRVIST